MDIYIVDYRTHLKGITGVRLEALEHPSLPANDGPGFWQNENFVLTELQMYAVSRKRPSVGTPWQPAASPFPFNVTP